jgi:hypothetical protein
LSGSRWYVLGGVVAVMVGFGAWMMMRKPSPHAATAAAGGAGPVRGSGPSRGSQSPDPRQRSAPQTSMLDALKDELFQLETDRLQGKISQQDYDKAKSGLDMLFRRHMKKTGDQRT